MTIDRLDHLVLTVADIDVTCAFYSTILGMEVITFGADRKALKFGVQKINLHQKGKEFEPKAKHPAPGAADLCFITDTAIETVYSELASNGIEIVEGIADKDGAMGKIRSIYFRDPDGNLLEVSNY